MQTKEYYTYSDILEWMESGRPFSLRYVTFDRQRKRGGQVKYISEAEMVQAEEEERRARKIKGRPLTLEEIARLTAPAGRNPNHSYHFTRNVRILENGRPTSLIRKVHIILITEFNNCPVTP